MRLSAALLALAALSGCASCPRSMHVVPFALGAPAFRSGDSIEIVEIAGTRPRLQVGGIYVITGRAVVASHDGARLAVSSTGADDAYRTKGYTAVDLPRGASDFELAVAIVGDGDLHVTLAPRDDAWSNHPFGGIYFRDPDRPFLFGGAQDLDDDTARTAPTPSAVARQDHSVLTITGATWEYGNVEQGVVALLVDEWYDDQDGEQYRRFTEACDPEFVLRADGVPDVHATILAGSITGTGLHCCALEVPCDRMQEGVTYHLLARNRDEQHKWVVGEGVTLTRP